MRAEQRTAGPQLGSEQLDPLGLGETRVVLMDTRPGQQLGDDLFVHLRVLPHIQALQMESECLDGVSQCGQPVVGEQTVAAGPQRDVDRIKVVQYRLRGRVGRCIQIQAVRRQFAERGDRRCRQARPNPMQRTAIRLIRMRRGIGITGLGQCGHLRGHSHQPRRLRQRLLQLHQLAQIPNERHRRCLRRRLTYDIGCHIRIPVTIATDP